LQNVQTARFSFKFHIPFLIPKQQLISYISATPIRQSTIFSCLKFTVHSRFTICGDACPLSCVNAEACLTGWLAQCMSLQGWGKLVNSALLSLINEACVNVCCATLLSSELVGPACVQARSSNPRGRACRPKGKGMGEEGIY